MATKAVKVKAHKRLSGTGKIENVDAYIRQMEIDHKVMAKTMKYAGFKDAKVVKNMAMKQPWEVRVTAKAEEIKAMQASFESMFKKPVNIVPK